MKALRHLLYRCAQIGAVLLGLAAANVLTGDRAHAQGAIGLHLGTAHSSSTYTTQHPLLDRDTLQRIGTVRREHRYEAFNPGAYVRLDGGATFGAYRNSYGRATAYAGWTWQTADQRFALTTGAVVGERITPLLAPSLRLPITRDVAARLVLLPRQPGAAGSATALHLAVEVSR